MREVIEITLTPEEIFLAEYIGTRRNETQRSINRTNLRRDEEQSDVEVSIRGMGAELSMARYLNLYPDMVMFTDKLPPYDLISGDTELEIKSTRYLQGRLLVRTLREGLVYVLVCGLIPDYELTGWIQGCEITKENGYRSTMGLERDPILTVFAEDLEPIETLKPFLGLV